ncbi:MAG TPA: hypothetical protein VIJ46_07090, partial [Rhabdochlamydiaceae bacterium]
LLAAALAMLLMKTADVWYAIFAASALCSLWIVALCFKREGQNTLLENEAKLQGTENRLQDAERAKRDLVKECNHLKEAGVQRSFQEQKKLEKIELERDAAHKKTGDLFLELSALKEQQEQKQHELIKKVEDAEFASRRLVGEFNALKEELARKEKLIQEAELDLEDVSRIAHHRLDELNTVRVENFELAQFAAQAMTPQEVGDLKQLKNQLAERTLALSEARSERFHLETELLALQKEKEQEEVQLEFSEELRQQEHLEEAVDHLEDLVSLILLKKKRKKIS